MSPYDDMAQGARQLQRGQVWCTVCGHTQRVDGPGALQHGWPKHCGYTMTIDSPEERAAQAQLATEAGAP